ncbi:hypothetical protein ACE1BY_21120, partial [Aeromonas jandaei]
MQHTQNQPRMVARDAARAMAFALEKVTNAMNNGGKTIPRSNEGIAGCNTVYFHELLANHREDLELVCCHRNTWIGSKDTKSSLFGTNYTKTAERLLDVANGIATAYGEHNFLNQLLGVDLHPDQNMDVHHVYDNNINHIMNAGDLKAPTTQEWKMFETKMFLLTNGSELKGKTKLVWDSINKDSSTFAKETKKYMYDMYTYIKSKGLTDEKKDDYYRSFILNVINDCAQAYDSDNSISCPGGILERFKMNNTLLHAVLDKKSPEDLREDKINEINNNKDSANFITKVINSVNEDGGLISSYRDLCEKQKIATNNNTTFLRHVLTSYVKMDKNDCLLTKKQSEKIDNLVSCFIKNEDVVTNLSTWLQALHVQVMPPIG